MPRRANKTDDNHQQELDKVRAYGIAAKSTHDVKGFCDWVLTFAGLTIHVELKDLAKMPKKYHQMNYEQQRAYLQSKLTDEEKHYQTTVHQAGGIYLVACSADEVIKFYEMSVIDAIQARIIEHVKGNPNALIIQPIQTGFHYQAYCTLGTALTFIQKKGDQMLVPTRQIFKDGEPILYCFHNKEQRKIFDLLRSVSGVGANTSLRIIDEQPYYVIRQEIENKNQKFFESLNGIGSKTAKNIINTLHKKVI